MGTSFIEKLQKYWHTITIAKRIFLGISLLIVISIFVAMLFWINRDTYRVLYRNVTIEEANTITNFLTENKIPFKLSNNDQDISVPSNMVSKIRLQIAGENSFALSGKGFEIFDTMQVGQTDFVQKINYQRALQGELARSIMEFPAVAKARVHLVLPEQSLFVEKTIPPSASVVLTLKPNKTMTPQETQTIVNLLSMSIEGLTPNSISIVDTAGNTLYTPTGENTLQGMTTTQLEYTTTLQKNIEKRIEELLIPIVGAGNAIAKVTAQLDFSQKTIRKENYDPDTIAIRSEQSIDNSQKGISNLITGIPNANFKADINNGESSQESIRTSKTINYEVSKEEQNIISAVGTLEKLSIAVIVDGNYTKTQEGKTIFQPKTQEELNTIRDLVASAVGFDSARGDTLEISSAAFQKTQEQEALDTSFTWISNEQVGRIATFLFNSALLFLFLIFVIKPLVGNFIRSHPLDELTKASSLFPEKSLENGTITADIPEEHISIEEIKIHTKELADNNIMKVVAILRDWMHEEGTEKKFS